MGSSRIEDESSRVLQLSHPRFDSLVDQVAVFDALHHVGVEPTSDSDQSLDTLVSPPLAAHTPLHLLVSPLPQVKHPVSLHLDHVTSLDEGFEDVVNPSLHSQALADCYAVRRTHSMVCLRSMLEPEGESEETLCSAFVSAISCLSLPRLVANQAKKQQS